MGGEFQIKNFFGRGNFKLEFFWEGLFQIGSFLGVGILNLNFFGKREFKLEIYIPFMGGEILKLEFFEFNSKISVITLPDKIKLNALTD